MTARCVPFIRSTGLSKTLGIALRFFPASSASLLTFTRHQRSSPMVLLPFLSLPSHTLPLWPSGVVKWIGLGWLSWASICSLTLGGMGAEKSCFAPFIFNGLEGRDTRPLPVTRSAQFGQQFWRLPEPLSPNVPPHEVQRFFSFVISPP